MESEKLGFVNKMSEIGRKMQVKFLINIITMHSTSTKTDFTVKNLYPTYILVHPFKLENEIQFINILLLTF